jgi:hypothetical protein
VAAGHGAYALLTAAAVQNLDVPTDGAIPLAETYDGSPVASFVFALR